MRESIEKFMRDCLVDVKGCELPDGSEAFRALDMVDDLALDSLDVINVLFQVEQSHQIKISEPEIDEHNLLKVGNLIDHITATAD